MKISLFNSNAPALINKFEGVLNKLLNGDTKGIDFSSLRTNLNTANGLAAEAQSVLNSVNLDQLKALRNNAKAGTEFGVAVDNAASLSHIVGVLTNMVNEIAPEDSKEEEVSLDDILDTDEKDEDNCGDMSKVTSANSDDEESKDSDDEEDEDADDIMDKNTVNGGPADIATGSEDASKDSADGEEAAVAEGDDISNALKNFFGTTKTVVKKTSNANVSNNAGLVPSNFLC